MNLTMAVVGAARSGKTLFCINFAEYLGARTLSYSEAGSTGRGRGAISPADAREMMVNRRPRGNGAVRTFAVHLQQPSRRVALIDTASLKERRPLPPFERSRLLLTLQAVQSAAAILQLIDLGCSDPARLEFDEEVGRCLFDFCLRQGKLFLTAGSKTDLLKGPLPVDRFTATGKMIYISSLSRAGFPSLRSRLLGRVSSIQQ